MARPVSSNLHDQSAAIRQLKLLVVVLVLSNVGLGVFSFYLLRKVDRVYSDLIDRSVPILSDLQTLTAKAVRAMRGTNPALAPADSPTGRTSIFEESRARFAEERALRNSLLKVEWLTGKSAERTEFEAAGEAFASIGMEVVSRLAAGDDHEAARLRDDKLRPAFERYLSAATKASDMLEAESQRVNDTVSASTGSMSKLVLGLAGWPVILLFGLLLLTAIFVLVLVVLYRDRGGVSITPWGNG